MVESRNMVWRSDRSDENYSYTLVKGLKYFILHLFVELILY